MHLEVSSILVPGSAGTSSCPVNKIESPWTIHDRVNQFMIEHKMLLWRPLEEKNAGWNVTILQNEAVPYEVKADWENVMVLDIEGKIHYAKSCNSEGTLMDKPQWFKGIWNLPVISNLYNAFVKESNIKAEIGSKWACSYIEAGCYYVDHAKRLCFLGSGDGMLEATTTAYVADQKERKFRYYDPYLPSDSEDKEDIFIPFPETAERYFEIAGCASSRSGLFCLGYDVNKAEREGVEKTLRAYFISADANLLGVNPFVSYTYERKTERKGDFVLPASLYVSIPLPEEGKLTSVIGVERGTGKVMSDVLLTIEGTKSSESSGEEVSGFYCFDLSKSQWSFVEVIGHQIVQEKLLRRNTVDGKGVFSPKVYTFRGGSADRKWGVMFKDFGENSLQSKIILEKENVSLELMLYTKQDVWDILGFDWKDFTLVLPEAAQRAPGWDEVVAVHLKQKNKILTMRRAKDEAVLFVFHLEAPVMSSQKGYCAVV